MRCDGGIVDDTRRQCTEKLPSATHGQAHDYYDYDYDYDYGNVLRREETLSSPEYSSSVTAIDLRKSRQHYHEEDDDSKTGCDHLRAREISHPAQSTLYNSNYYLPTCISKHGVPLRYGHGLRLLRH